MASTFDTVHGRTPDGTYCGTLTTAQVRNVYHDEVARMRRFDAASPVHVAARELALEAWYELRCRGALEGERRPS